MEKKGKLELTWVGKYDEIELEPRILMIMSFTWTCWQVRFLNIHRSVRL